ncbi:uncharacterized protein LOC115890192 [Sitophilus oryzae]|uniref:Uncharacterized protein LOC115890192 n=1 Tax=Sitophilus oryzae TaxID=7048 RepID=A0A6J2YSJ7_SITOR|nr:uncharacterized protein LOC115890192 [Sitophilus oryzae]
MRSPNEFSLTLRPPFSPFKPSKNTALVKGSLRETCFWSENLIKLIEEKKRSYQKWLSTHSDHDREEYARLNRIVKREVSKSKNKIWETKCERVERYMGGTRVSEAWKTIRNLRRDEKQNSKLELISMEKWEDHYKQLLTKNRTEFKLEVPDLKNAKDIDVNEISVNEIKKALKNSKNGKAAGPGNFLIELIKQGPDILLEILADILDA